MIGAALVARVTTGEDGRPVAALADGIAAGAVLNAEDARRLAWQFAQLEFELAELPAPDPALYGPRGALVRFDDRAPDVAPTVAAAAATRSAA